MAHLHDTGYKFLFSHADLVRELLEVFAPPGVTELLDYTTLRGGNRQLHHACDEKTRRRYCVVYRVAGATYR
jgi:hypothetical protein